MDRLVLARGDFSQRSSALQREWLVTNGLGGFAAGTISLANTRRYHGLLVAALRPPVERVVMVAKVDVAATYGGARYELTANEFVDGTLSPQGFRLLSEFAVDDGGPVWTWQLGDAILQQRIRMLKGSNSSVLDFQLVNGTDSVELELTPLCTYRDYHSHTTQAWSFDVAASERECTVRAYSDARPYRLIVDRGVFESHGDWYWRFHHEVEKQRGLDSEEHLFNPGKFRLRLDPGQNANLMVSADDVRTIAVKPAADGNIKGRQSRDLPVWIRTLTRAANDYIVTRAGGANEVDGKTVIAGYPWFADWGRDTMIALPGLTLATGRLDDAAAILRTFARHVSQGMLPNRFPDQGETPEYNTVDATLWYFHALDCYLQASDDRELLRELYPVMENILDWHRRGTRHGIRVDASDGLLRAGEPGVQLTWMDAKVGDWVVTPRSGKPVEINALWHFALTSMARWSRLLNRKAAADLFARQANQVIASFRGRFWNNAGSYLFDVVDLPDGMTADASLRPNQIFAVSLGADLLTAEQARAVVDVCGRQLLTPVGLRSLAPGDPAYIGRYQGGPLQRDGAYHQGTVWSWLLGPYALAHWRVHQNSAHALRLLEGLAPHLGEACIGQISEIFDGDAPHTPQGCFAQAWSVAETLRAWQVLQAAKPNKARSAHHA